MQDDEWPTVRIPAARLEQLEAERDHLAKQNEIYRKALTEIADEPVALISPMRKTQDEWRGFLDGLKANQELAAQAIKEAEGVE